MNYQYIILSKTDKSLKLKDISSEDIADVPMTIIKNNFIYNYCMTAHSTQGSSINDNITIFDYKFKHVNRNWLYVAVTRATDLNNVYFYNYKEDNDLYDNLINSYFQRKVLQYTKQDKEAKRSIDKDNFVNINWLESCINQTCRYCNTNLFIDIDSNDHIASNILQIDLITEKPITSKISSHVVAYAIVH